MEVERHGADLVVLSQVELLGGTCGTGRPPHVHHAGVRARRGSGAQERPGAAQHGWGAGVRKLEMGRRGRIENGTRRR